MIQGSERAKVVSPLDVIAARFHLMLSFLRGEVAAGSPDLARLGLIAMGMALQTVVLLSPGHFRPAPSPFFAGLVCLGTLASVAVSLLATMRLRRLYPPRTRQILGAFALAALLILSVIGIWKGAVGLRAMAQGTPYGNDGAAMDLYAAQQVQHAHNPYLKTNIVDALAAINAPAVTTTPLMDGQFRGARAYPSDTAVQQAFMSDFRYRSKKGVATTPEFESKYNYPAGSFLFILPFVWAGFHDMRFLYLMAIFAMGAYLWMRMPTTLRPLVPLLLLSDVPLVVLTTSGQPDPIYGLFLLIGYAEWPSMWLSPACMGLAIGTKQLAWFFVPLYLVLIASRLGWRESVRRVAIMAGVFVVLNGPFIAMSPDAYISGVAGPLQDPMFPLGIGIVALFVANVLPMIPKFAFTVMELIAWTLATLASARSRFLAPAAAPALASLPLFFAWRSLSNYFYLVPLITLAIVFADNARSRYQQAET